MSMKNLSRSVLSAAAALVSFAAAPAFAAEGQAAYQCTVLGDTTACASAPQQALDGAAAYRHFLSGSVAVRASDAPRAIDGQAAYQRLFGVSAATPSRAVRASRSSS